MTNKVLITGFEPFGGKNKNITQQALEGVDEFEDVYAEILPVEFGRAAALAARLAEDDEFDSILLLGERPSLTPVIGFEKQAHNRAFAAIVPDNANRRRLWSPVIKGGPSTLAATMDYEAIRPVLKVEGMHNRVQQKIGRFVCNDVFYQMLHLQKVGEINPDVQIGFAHIGSGTGEVAANTAVRRLVTTLRDDTL